MARKPRIGGKEFDTLALHQTTKVPVIIEYKREKDRDVVEQVDLYYVKLKHNSKDVLILLSDVTEDLADVDLESPQIIVVAKEFTPEQRELLTLKKDYLRLVRYQLYEGDILTLEDVQPVSIASARQKSLKAASQQYAPGHGTAHFGMRPQTEELYRELDEEIQSLDSRVRPGKINKHYVGYGATGYYFCSVKPRPTRIKIEVKLRRNPLKTRGIDVRKVPEYQNTPMTHVFQISNHNQIRPALKVVKTALEDSL